MSVKERTLLLASVITCFLIQAQGADKYTDGNRPYEFGFSIDGEQHRHEKKDEKGLIEGEFGFITADGVYHVTVYATDEQGRFKILSMKNIRVKPYPTYTAKQSNTSARQGHSLDLPAEQATVSSPVATTTLKPISIGRPVGSCSSCSIPTTSTAAPVIPESSQPLAPNQIGTAVNPKFPQGIKSQSVFENQPNNANVPSQQGFGAISSPQGSSLNIPNYSTQSLNGFSQAPLAQDLVPPQHPENPQNPQQGFSQNQNSPNGFNSPPTNFQGPGSSISLQSPERPTFPQQQQQTLANSPPVPQNTYLNNGAEIENSPNPDRGNVASGRTPKRLDNGPSIQGTQPNNLQRGVSNDQGSLTPTKPTLISAQMQIVDKNTDIYRRGPGENEGLPEGLTTDDMSKLLYTFNYTVGFHGHFEEGYTNGFKQGYYFITGRNGVRTRVDYTADSTGFHPKISQEVLDLLSDDVPKPETEKEEKYGLKGYEFKWLYYPVEAKGR